MVAEDGFEIGFVVLDAVMFPIVLTAVDGCVPV